MPPTCFPETPTVHGLRPPLGIRLANLALDTPLTRSLATWSDPDRLLTTASRRAGLDDFGDPTFRSFLDRQVDGFATRGNLSPFGKLVVRETLLETLGTRLRCVDTLRRHPEIEARPIRRPIFVTGLYRSGTTLLHHLLCGVRAYRAPLFWELRNPCPPGAPSASAGRSALRRERIKNWIHRYIMPSFDVAHPLAVESPHECMHLFEHAFASPSPVFLSEDTSFATWLLEQDLRPAYRFYRQQLQLLDWQRPGQRWIMKWPYHLWHLDALIEEFPDALIVQLHRRAAESIPSLCSLTTMTRAPFVRASDGAALGRFWLDHCRAGLERAGRFRAAGGGASIIDVLYDQLVAAPSATLRRILSAAGDDPRQLDEIDLSHHDPNGRRGPRARRSHRYSPRQFGLTDVELAQEFDELIAHAEAGCGV